MLVRLSCRIGWEPIIWSIGFTKQKVFYMLSHSTTREGVMPHFRTRDHANQSCMPHGQSCIENCWFITHKAKLHRASYAAVFSLLSTIRASIENLLLMAYWNLFSWFLLQLNSKIRAINTTLAIECVRSCVGPSDWNLWAAWDTILCCLSPPQLPIVKQFSVVNKKGHKGAPY